MLFLKISFASRRMLLTHFYLSLRYFILTLFRYGDLVNPIVEAGCGWNVHCVQGTPTLATGALLPLIDRGQKIKNTMLKVSKVSKPMDSGVSLQKQEDVQGVQLSKRIHAATI